MKNIFPSLLAQEAIATGKPSETPGRTLQKRLLFHLNSSMTTTTL